MPLLSISHPRFLGRGSAPPYFYVNVHSLECFIAFSTFVGQEARCQMKPRPGPGSLLVGREEKALLAVRDRAPWRARLILLYLLFLQREKSSGQWLWCLLVRERNADLWGMEPTLSSTCSQLYACSLLSLFLPAVLQPALVILVLQRLRAV